jgi:prevent-host-death family protein
MMPQVGIRELRDRASEILRQVREEKNEYIITYQGAPVALLIPVDQQALEQYLHAEAQRGASDESLTRQLYGLVKATLSETELDELTQEGGDG